ncbi:hypothetical protein [Streptomyces sp. NPDC004286]|uniref:hypothetical protein n=1 Tax=unclassified Streptomyces TaxID=2593676 RepID=UPI0036CBF231
MNAYNHPGSTSGRPVPGGDGTDLETLIQLADGLVAALHAEYPVLLAHGEIIVAELALAADDGFPPNRGRIRHQLDDLCIGAAAGTGTLEYTRRLTTALNL